MRTDSIDDSTSPYRKPRQGFFFVLTGLSLLATAWSPAGLAAMVSCDRISCSLQGPQDANTARTELTVEIVDLTHDADAVGASGDLTETVAPHLFLTPRVASILEDVFADSADSDSPAAAVQVSEQPAEVSDDSDGARSDGESQQSGSPVADNVSSPGIAQPATPMYENGAILPRFQRQMYRTDI